MILQNISRAVEVSTGIMNNLLGGYSCLIILALVTNVGLNIRSLQNIFGAMLKSPMGFNIPVNVVGA
jgi:hypothetical protein